MLYFELKLNESDVLSCLMLYRPLQTTHYIDAAKTYQTSVANEISLSSMTLHASISRIKDSSYLTWASLYARDGDDCLVDTTHYYRQYAAQLEMNKFFVQKQLYI